MIYEVIQIAERNEQNERGGSANTLSLSRVLNAYKVILKQKKFTPGEDAIYYKALLKMSSDGEGNWWKKYEKLKQVKIYFGKFWEILEMTYFKKIERKIKAEQYHREGLLSGTFQRWKMRMPSTLHGTRSSRQSYRNNTPMRFEELLNSPIVPSLKVKKEFSKNFH